jgi:peptidoglycan/xylan/chitin deacetylase (PgdA/CDA1 family)
MGLNRIVGSARLVARLVSLSLAVFPAYHASAAERSAVILLYHRFGSVTGSTTVSDTALERQLAWLNLNVHVGTLRSVIDGLHTKNDRADRPCVAITADDGHRSVYSDLFPRIRRLGIPVTLFVYPSAISHAPYALTWQQLQNMAASGLVDVQSHTYWHPNFHEERAHRQPDDYKKFVDMQLSRSKQAIAAHLGHPVDSLAWPYGIVDEELEQAAFRAGYIRAFTIGDRPASSSDDLLALPRIWISDSDQGRRFATKITSACPLRTQSK